MQASESPSEPTNNQTHMSRRILMLLIIGTCTILIGLVILTIAATMSGNGSTGYGIIIFIGPIPIVLGAGPSAEWLILFAIALATLSIIVFYLMRKRNVETNV